MEPVIELHFDFQGDKEEHANFVPIKTDDEDDPETIKILRKLPPQNTGPSRINKVYDKMRSDMCSMDEKLEMHTLSANDNGYIDVKVGCSDDQFVNLRILRCNAYVVGFQTPTGKWFAFTDFKKHPCLHDIDPVMPMYVTGSYTGNDGVGMSNVAHGTPVNIVAAIKALANIEKKQDVKEVVKANLPILLLTICEAFRFAPLQNELSRAYATNPSESSYAWETLYTEFVGKWRKISQAYMLDIFDKLPFKWIKNRLTCRKILSVALEVNKNKPDTQAGTSTGKTEMQGKGKDKGKGKG